MNIILNILLLFLCCWLYYLYIKEKEKNKEIDEINQEIKKENEKIYTENENLLEKQRLINSIYNQKQEELSKIQETINESQERSQKAFENYAEILDEEYKTKEKEYNESIQLLNDSYSNIQNRINGEIDKINEDLNKISSTRAAAVQAQLKEQEIKNKSAFYSLSIDDIDKREIRILHTVENELRNPRSIRMIIWQTYYSKKANELITRILGSNDKIGIYKITNLKSGLCYIGQSKSIKERLREHMKCGLGIDTPQNNKLYKAMLEDGIDNFTFELLEECKSEYLDEKEAFYIDLYDSYNFGYNNQSGNKKL